jgi:prepilin-type N-terminal cleavage/methylation domain-containing protein
MRTIINLKCKSQKKKGFTLIEVLISLLLVLIALLSISRILIFTLEGNKKSFVLSQLTQQLESYKDKLISLQFDSKELEPGTTTILDHPFKTVKTISNISPTLKIIRLSIIYEAIIQSIYFYKSKYIKEVKND